MPNNTSEIYRHLSFSDASSYQDSSKSGAIFSSKVHTPETTVFKAFFVQTKNKGSLKVLLYYTDSDDGYVSTIVRRKLLLDTFCSFYTEKRILNSHRDRTFLCGSDM